MKVLPLNPPPKGETYFLPQLLFYNELKIDAPSSSPFGGRGRREDNLNNYTNLSFFDINQKSILLFPSPLSK